MYDGWETRRRIAADPVTIRPIVRLGVPGVIRGVVVDTAWFKGNYPPEVSLSALAVEGYPPAEEIAARTDWVTLVDRVEGRRRQPQSVRGRRRRTGGPM